MAIQIIQIIRAIVRWTLTGSSRLAAMDRVSGCIVLNDPLRPDAVAAAPTPRRSCQRVMGRQKISRVGLREGKGECWSASSDERRP